MPASLTEAVIIGTTKPPFHITFVKKALFTGYHTEITQSSLYTRNHKLSTPHQAGNNFPRRIQPSHPNIALRCFCQHNHSVLYPKYSGLWHTLKHYNWHEPQSGQWSVTTRLISHIWKGCSQPFFNTGLVSRWLITLCAAWLAWSTCWQLNWGCCWRLFCV